jgi:hypothetical protein
VPEPTRGHVAGQAFALLAGGFLLYIVLWYLLDPPPTYSCTEPWPAEMLELNERRGDYLLVALPILIAYGAWLGSTAWRAAAARNGAQGRPTRPGNVVLTFSALLVPLWAYLVGTGLTEQEVGEAYFYGLFFGALGLALVALCAIALCVLALGATRRPSWLGPIESISVLMLWAGLLSVLPALCVLAAVAGKDATLFC